MTHRGHFWLRFILFFIISLIGCVASWNISIIIFQVFLWKIITIDTILTGTRQDVINAVNQFTSVIYYIAGIITTFAFKFSWKDISWSHLALSEKIYLHSILGEEIRKEKEAIDKGLKQAANIQKKKKLSDMKS